MLLMRLAMNYYRPDFTEGQAKLMVKDMVGDLDTYHVNEIDVAIQKYRRDASNRFFPRSGQLIDLIEANRKERRELDRYASKPDTKGKSRPLMWWMKPKTMWDVSWRECEVPDGEMIRERHGASFREPAR